ncbi:MAG: TonB-dependent receptor, partial [Acidobacteria bacterium]|nr:TonB-dependent receptor [Acidobacteriota bacterium]
MTMPLMLLMALVVAPDEGRSAEAEQVVNVTIVVTPSGTERALADEPASVTVLDREDLLSDPALVLDDVLQSVPGFSLFRRQSSIVAHPTTQGVSLRGTGASGAGRALVLRDGVPLNDPFGGWVLWGRGSRQSLDRIEVVRGGGAELYGTSAVGGVIQLFTLRPNHDSVSVSASAGELGTVNGAMFGSLQRGPWTASVNVEGFSTDGWFITRESDRGTIDRRAGSDHWLADLTVRRTIPGGEAFLDLSRYEESRTNGTELQENGTDISMAAAGIDWTIGSTSLSARGWISEQEMRSTFSAVSDDRNSERLVRDQHVPADALGLNVRAIRPAGDQHLLVAGTELRRVDAISRESIFIPGRIIPAESGGEQELSAFWIEDIFAVSPQLEVTAGLRWDTWRNQEQFDEMLERTDSALSPRLSIFYRTSPRIGIAASAYRAFRAPTLNELYRGFRVGDVVTSPNPELRAETMTGFDAGINAGGPSDRWDGRLRLFWMEVSDPIANVTIDVTEDLILRQRRNLGETRSNGIELDGSWRISPDLRLRGGWLWSRSEITSYSADPTIEGNRIPQVPAHQGTLELRWSGLRSSATIQTHYVGSQFEDDENRFLLPSYVTVDLHLSRVVRNDLSLFLAGENLLDEHWTAGRTPLETIGPPRLVRGGMRWSWRAGGRAPGSLRCSSRAPSPARCARWRWWPRPGAPRRTSSPGS